MTDLIDIEYDEQPDEPFRCPNDETLICEHADICDWWNVCTGDCRVCDAVEPSIKQWCARSCALHTKLVAETKDRSMLTNFVIENVGGQAATFLFQTVDLTVAELEVRIRAAGIRFLQETDAGRQLLAERCDSWWTIICAMTSEDWAKEGLSEPQVVNEIHVSDMNDIERSSAP